MAITIKKSPANRTEARNAQHNDPVVENAAYGITRSAEDGSMLLSGLYTNRTERGQHVYTVRVEAADVIRMTTSRSDGSFDPMPQAPGGD